MVLKRLTDLLLFTSLFIAFGAFALIARTYIFYNEEINIKICSFVFTSTLFTYNFTKIIPIFFRSDKQEYAYNRRNQWNFEHKKLLIIITLVSGITSAYLFLNLNIKQQVFMLHLGAISIFYALPILKGKTLRDFPFFKVFLIAYTWAATSILPFIEQGFNTNNITIFTGNFLFVLTITFPFDFRDYSRDKAQKISTVPHLLNINGTKILASILLIGSLFFIPSKYFWHEIIITILTLPLLCFSSEKKGEYYFLGLIDGLLILKFVILFF